MHRALFISGEFFIIRAVLTSHIRKLFEPNVMEIPGCLKVHESGNSSYISLLYHSIPKNTVLKILRCFFDSGIIMPSRIALPSTTATITHTHTLQEQLVKLHQKYLFPTAFWRSHILVKRNFNNNSLIWLTHITFDCFQLLQIINTNPFLCPDYM